MAAPNPSILWYFLLRSILIVPELALVGCKSGSCESRFDWSPVVNKTCTFLLDIESNKNARDRKVSGHVYVCQGYRFCLDFSVRCWNCFHSGVFLVFTFSAAGRWFHPVLIGRQSLIKPALSC
jgi:hypothetical protein